MDKLLQWDTKVFLWFNNLGNEAWDPFWLFVSEKFTWVPLYALLLLMLVRAKHGKAMWVALGLLVVNIFLTDQGSTWFFKQQFERLRPCHVEALQGQMRIVKEGCGGQYGFLSAHAANTFGMAMLLGLVLRQRFRWLLPVLLCWAAFCGLQPGISGCPLST
ncbi:MAG: phosphatase PAP2 family protein [Owenweeksia sp.]|nr:phosphatase PAP2 family protein [Owenweeksia sp.]